MTAGVTPEFRVSSVRRFLCVGKIPGANGPSLTTAERIASVKTTQSVSFEREFESANLHVAILFENLQEDMYDA